MSLKYILVVNTPPGQKQAPNPVFYFFKRNVETLYNSRKGQSTVRMTYGCAGLGGWKKRMSFCNGADKGLNVTLCESRPTSNWSFFARE